MEKIILRNVPENWLTSKKQYLVEKNTIEYQTIKNLVNINKSTIKIKRIQDKMKYGQFLIREQLNCVHIPNNYYRVRRFISIPLSKLKEALTYDLDSRCGLDRPLLFYPEVDFIPDHVVLVVLFLVKNPFIDVINSDDCDYFIEYIVEF